MNIRMSRSCRDHEKSWNKRCVDKNLKEEWLQRLNSLNTLDLISVCEGHPEREGCTKPHLKFKLRAELTPVAMQRFAEHSINLEMFSRFNHKDTESKCELKRTFRTARKGFNYREDIMVRITCRCPRTSEKIDEKTINWFERNVVRVEELDGFIVGLFKE